jgi:endonuclease IV
VLIGSHVHDEDPLAAASAEGAEMVQFFLGNPQSWKRPKPREDAEALIDAVERIKSITRRIDLVHCNDSRDAADSGADRHANFGTGQIDPQLLVAVVTAAAAPVICETSDEGRKDDIAFLRENV